MTSVKVDGDVYSHDDEDSGKDASKAHPGQNCQLSQSADTGDHCGADSSDQGPYHCAYSLP